MLLLDTPVSACVINYKNVVNPVPWSGIRKLGRCSELRKKM